MANRRFIHAPEINPHTFLLFYFQGPTGRRYSFRDYSLPGGSVRITRARDYSYTVDEIMAMAKWSFDAPAHSTEDIEFWRGQIAELNKHYLPSTSSASEEAAISAANQRDSVPPPTRSSAPPNSFGQGPGVLLPPVEYPVLAPFALARHAVKGKKTSDMQRILTSARSEDYVTWNIVQLLEILDPRVWWNELIDLARKNNPALELVCKERDFPSLKTWQLFPSPVQYERNSRTRMERSENKRWQARSKKPRPVEGETEVDLMLEGREYVLMIEAKCDSDISMSTTYDPGRNQILRNIDVVLENAGDRTPAFWLLAPSEGEGRAYTQLLRSYRRDPGLLSKMLPHRTSAEIAAVSRNLALITWADTIGVVRHALDQILNEVARRVQL